MIVVKHAQCLDFNAVNRHQLAHVYAFATLNCDQVQRAIGKGEMYPAGTLPTTVCLVSFDLCYPNFHLSFHL